MNDLITAKDLNQDEFGGFLTEKERIKYMSSKYKNMSITKAFSIFYDIELSQDVKVNKSLNNVQDIIVGNIYSGYVKSFDKHGMVFDIPGVKDEIVSKENFNDCAAAINNYLLNHDNKLIFEIREHKKDKYIVSVINAYYRLWINQIEKAIKNENCIEVHIDSLVRGGYLCSTNIATLSNLTGRKYTHSVFIPGSHIVLNIERDFEKWIGQDVYIVPQKFVEFRKNLHTGETENSLVGSRKRVLEILGLKNMEEMYKIYAFSKSNDAVSYEPETLHGIVTGIINSNNKTGVFVEIADKYITGLTPMSSSELLDYKPGDPIDVKIKEFEIKDSKDPFVYSKKGQIVKSNCRAVFELA